MITLLSLSGVFYSKHHNTDKPTTFNKEPHNEPFDADNKLGIVVGISISSFFLLTLIVICVAKEPCRKVRSNGGTIIERNYYQQKLLTDNSSSNRLIDSAESSEAGNNRNKSKNYILFAI